MTTKTSDQRILDLLHEGLSDRAIADRLHVGRNRVAELREAYQAAKPNAPDPNDAAPPSPAEVAGRDGDGGVLRAVLAARLRILSKTGVGVGLSAVDREVAQGLLDVAMTADLDALEKEVERLECRARVHGLPLQRAEAQLHGLVQAVERAAEQLGAEPDAVTRALRAIPEDLESLGDVEARRSEAHAALKAAQQRLAALQKERAQLLEVVGPLREWVAWAWSPAGVAWLQATGALVEAQPAAEAAAQRAENATRKLLVERERLQAVREEARAAVEAHRGALGALQREARLVALGFPPADLVAAVEVLARGGLRWSDLAPLLAQLTPPHDTRGATS